MTDQLPFTGERFVPELVREIWYEHWHRYAFALPFVGGRRVLDCACGEGYGSRILAGRADRVTGLDLSAEAVEHARRRYGERGNLKFVEGDCTALPFPDDAFDVVVSFETLEHIEGQQTMLAEFRRVLGPRGLLILSSPDKRIYSDEREFQNEFHVRELYRDELIELVSRYFPAWRLHGQKLMFQSMIWPLDADSRNYRLGVVDERGAYAEHSIPPNPPLYFIMLCAADESALPQDPPALDLFADAAESVYEHYNAEVRHHIESGAVLDRLRGRVAKLEAELETAREMPRRWWQRLLGRRR